MSDSQPLPPDPPVPATEPAADTTNRAVEATGPVPQLATLASNHPDVPHPVVVGLQRIGEYKVVRKIGEGGMGAVYLAEDAKLGRKVAIKTMKPELAANPSDRDRFVREARAAAAVEHDNIVPILHIGEAVDGTPFIVMPFLHGEMLDSRLQRQPVASVGLLLKVAREVSEGLAAAHAVGLIHRDIKPANVWVEGDLSAKEPSQQTRRCKILDFGLARSVDKEEIQLTASGTILGTPAYMAPEQARGEKVDHRADLFSLGVMLYRMATGQLPFNGPTAMAVLIALATEPAPPVRALNPNIPPALADLIERLMSKDPTGRPGTAAEVAATVRQISKHAKKSSPYFHTPVPAPEQQTEALPTPAHRTESLPVAAEDSSSQPRVLPAHAANNWEETETDAARAPIPKAAPVPPKRGRRLLLAGIAVALLAGVAAAWIAATVLRVETPNGTLVVEIDDPEVEARIKNGKLVLVGPDGNIRYTLSPSDRNQKVDPGPYTIRVEGADGLILNTPEFTLTNGGTVTVRVTLDPRAVAKKPDPPKMEPPKKSDPPKEIAIAPPPRAVVVALDPDRAAAEWVLSARGTVFVNGDANGIKAAKNLPKDAFRLTDVNLTAPTKDADLAVFKNCTNLTGLYLVGTGITDAGLAHFGGCKNMTNLFLSGTKVSDAALPTIKLFTKLMDLSVGVTDVSEKGVRELAKALPKCRIQWTGGTIEPTPKVVPVEPSPDQKAAEWVLSIGGTAVLQDDAMKGAPLTVRDRAELPKGPFRVTGVLLGGNKQVTDAGLGVFANCAHVADLQLYGTAVTDAGLAHFKNCKNLTKLALHGTQIGDAGLAQFAGRDNVTVLMLSSTKVTDAGLAHFKGCKRLTQIELGNTQVGDGVAHFKGCTQLTGLHLGNTAVSDTGLAQMRDCVNLTHCTLEKTKVTAKGVTELALALPKCRIDWDDGTIEPRPANLKLDPAAERAAAEWVLSVGGTVEVNANRKPIDNAAKLPKALFRLTGAFAVNKKVSDADLAAFKGCTQLEQLDLSGTAIAGPGLLNLKGCDRLALVRVERTRLTANDLFPVAGALPKCRIEWDGDTLEPATEADAKAAERVLALGGTYRVNGAMRPGLNAPKGAPFRVTRVDLTERAEFDDAALGAFKECKSLTEFRAGKTKITAKGIDALQQALPWCKVVWDGGTREPLAQVEADRKAAAYVLSVGGAVRVNGDDKDITAANDLPAGAYRLTGIDLRARKKVTDDSLAVFKTCRNLTSINLGAANVGDAALVHFAKCKNLSSIDLSLTAVTDAGLAHLKLYDALEHAFLKDAKVTKEGVDDLVAALPTCHIDWTGGAINPPKK